MIVRAFYSTCAFLWEYWFIAILTFPIGLVVHWKLRGWEAAREEIIIFVAYLLGPLVILALGSFAYQLIASPAIADHEKRIRISELESQIGKTELKIVGCFSTMRSVHNEQMLEVTVLVKITSSGLRHLVFDGWSLTLKFPNRSLTGRMVSIGKPHDVTIKDHTHIIKLEYPPDQEIREKLIRTPVSGERPVVAGVSLWAFPEIKKVEQWNKSDWSLELTGHDQFGNPYSDRLGVKDFQSRHNPFPPGIEYKATKIAK